MAELPDLTVFAKILTKRFGGKKLQEVKVSVAKKLKVSIDEFKKTLEGRKLESIEREGKTLQFHFSGNTVLGLHLMLRGQLALIEKGSPKPKSEIMAFYFEGGNAFAVIDSLKQATPTLNPPKAQSPDALDIDFESFKRLLSKTKRVIKEVLMDQKSLRGIGNSYADEILWDAKISPLSIANALPEKAVKALFQSLGSVLRQAIKDIAKANGDELQGELRDFMKVHGSKIEQSPSGAKIKSTKIGGRQAYYTDEQHLYT